LALRGDTRRARDIVERWFAPPPRTWTRIQAIAYWAQVAIELGIPDPGWLYSQLIARTGQLAIVGAGVDCGGAVDSLLAGLAWRLGQFGSAAEHSRAGLALDTRIGSRIWVTRSKELIARIEGDVSSGARPHRLANQADRPWPVPAVRPGGSRSGTWSFRMRFARPISKRGWDNIPGYAALKDFCGCAG
jgi:hypothetical protein